MTTSGGGTLTLLCFLAVVAALVTAAAVAVDVGAELRRFRRVSVALWLAVTVPSVLGILWDPFYDALYRDPDRIRDGQLWRLVTGSVVQDGGVAGAVFNLVLLWIVVSVAAAVWGERGTAVLAVVGVVAFNAVAAFLLDAAGGGNSGPTLFLASTVLGLLFVTRRQVRTEIAFAVAAVAGLVLVATLDAHGLPVLAGLVVGFGAARRRA